MANPQVENGHVKIANEIIEALIKANLNGTQFRIILLVIRATYGFNKKEHEISVSFIKSGTQIDSRQIRRELKALIDMKIINIVKEASFNSTRIMSFNKNYEEWGLIRQQRVTISTEGEIDHSTEGELDHSTEGEIDHSTEGKIDLQKRQYKDNIKTNIKTSASAEIDSFFESIWSMYPNKKGKSSISKTAKGKLFKIGEAELLKAIERYKKDQELNPWRKAMNGSTFFNGRYADYLQYEPEEEQKPKVSFEPKANNYDEWM